MSPDQQKSKVNTQQKLGARTGPKVLQFLRLLSTRCLVLAGDACLSLSFSCFFFLLKSPVMGHLCDMRIVVICLISNFIENLFK